MIIKISAAIAMLVALSASQPQAPNIDKPPTATPCYACPRPGVVDVTPATPKIPVTPTPAPYPGP